MVITVVVVPVHEPVQRSPAVRMRVSVRWSAACSAHLVRSTLSSGKPAKKSTASAAHMPCQVMASFAAW